MRGDLRASSISSSAQVAGRQFIHFDVAIVPQQQAIVRPEHAKVVAHMVERRVELSIVVAASGVGSAPVACRTPGNPTDS
jgi:hypothetical protein